MKASDRTEAGAGANLLALGILLFLLALSATLFLTKPAGPDAIAMEPTTHVLISMPDSSMMWAEEVSSESGITKGLSGRDALCPGCGMLFVFRDSAVRSFWMKGMKFPLDMIFIDEKCKVVRVSESVPPCDGECAVSYSSGEPAKYVLEANAGYAARHNLSKGALLCFNATHN
jgi:uncharacterized membrane protein (UPF0127 family)